MEEKAEKCFSEFLDSEQADHVYETFQNAIRQSFISGYKEGLKANMSIIYINNKGNSAK